MNFFLLLAGALLICFWSQAAEPIVSSNDLPRIPAVEPAEAIKTFDLKPGFRIERVVSEPNISSPVALAFDENNGLFVVEMIDYSERREETPHLGRIRFLQDTDGDGKFEKSQVYADNLPWPTAVFCYGGGIFVGATPDILYLKDVDGDGRADQREVVFTGFAEGVKRINVQGMLNSFIWGLDNRIHGATSGNGGTVRSSKHPQSPALDLRGRDFVIEPRSLTMTSEAGGGQHGLSFDDRGHRFACNNSDHIRLFLYDDYYATRNAAFPMPSGLASIAVDGPAAEVYRISPEEPWRVIRTRWRVAGLVGGPIEGGGRSAGYFTGATGTLIYRGNAFPAEYSNNAFVGDAGGNLVHRKVLSRDGVGFKAERGPGEEKKEFLASKDTWFRPVQFANAPDGALYVIDMYREVIEHPWSLPDNIKKFLDLNSGNNRGRIYRIVPDSFRQPKPPRLGKASTEELVSTLEHANGWHRDTAARLLYERQDEAAVPLLTSMLRDSKRPLARLHALHSLEGLKSLTEAIVLSALNDRDPAVREHAIKLSEKRFIEGKPSPGIWKRLGDLAQDPDMNVRYQLAFTLGETKEAGRIDLLAEIAKRDLENASSRAAILSSLAQGAGELFGRLASQEGLLDRKAGQEFLRQLALLVGAQNQPGQVESVLQFTAKLKDPGLTFRLVQSLGDGLLKAGAPLARSTAPLGEIFNLAQRIAGDAHPDESTRVAAIQLLSLTSFSEAGQTLVGRLNLKEPQAVQVAAVTTLARFNDAEVGPGLIAHWSGMTPRVRSEALAALLARPERAMVLLEAVESGTVQRAVLDSTQQKFLRNHKEKAVRELAAKVLETKAGGTRQQTVDAFMPALSLKGDAVHGKKLYQERCFSCHKLGGEGHALGPDLVTVKNSGKEKLLVNILDPNREVRPEYISYLVETRGEDSLIGLVQNETAASIALRQAYGKEDIIPRATIIKMQSQGQSIMPEGLEAGMTTQDLADLLEYIETAAK